MFAFLAATVVAVSTFLSVAISITTPAKERQIRDRLALLKTTAEQAGENAARVLSVLQQDDEERAARRERAERRSWLDSRVILIAIEIGLIAMLISLGDVSAWSVGWIPLLLGFSVILIGVLRGSPQKGETHESHLRIGVKLAARKTGRRDDGALSKLVEVR